LVAVERRRDAPLEVALRTLQWGHGLVAVESVPLSMVAMQFSQRFNGATAW